MAAGTRRIHVQAVMICVKYINEFLACACFPVPEMSKVSVGRSRKWAIEAAVTDRVVT